MPKITFKPQFSEPQAGGRVQRRLHASGVRVASLADEGPPGPGRVAIAGVPVRPDRVAASWHLNPHVGSAVPLRVEEACRPRGAADCACGTSAAAHPRWVVGSLADGEGATQAERWLYLVRRAVAQRAEPGPGPTERAICGDGVSRAPMTVATSGEAVGEPHELEWDSDSPASQSFGAGPVAWLQDSVRTYRFGADVDAVLEVNAPGVPASRHFVTYQFHYLLTGLLLHDLHTGLNYLHDYLCPVAGYGGASTPTCSGPTPWRLYD